MVKRKQSYKQQKGKGATSNSFNCLWNGIKRVGKASAYLVLSGPIAVVASPVTLMAYLKAQPDGEDSMVSNWRGKIVDEIKKNREQDRIDHLDRTQYN